MIYELENKMWESAKNSDRSAFSELVSDDAVMICGGFRCTGKQYADFIAEFGITGFEIRDFETVIKTEKAVQVHYIVKTIVDTEENEDLEGLFHVVSTWEEQGGKWKLVFNMDSRIME